MAIRTAISFVLTDQPLAWSQAYNLSLTTSGSLWKITESVNEASNLFSAMAEASPQDNINESSFWVGAHRVGSNWVWIDGTIVDPSYFNPTELNTDSDPSNDSADVYYGGSLDDPSAPFRDAPRGLILEYFGNSITGTNYTDWFTSGGAGPGKTVKLRGGDDFYVDSSDSFPNTPGGGTVDGGSGNDAILVYSGTGSTALDGDGQDYVEVYNGQIKASADGDDDVFVAPKVAYETAKQGMIVDGSIVSSSEIGTDEMRGVFTTNERLLYTGEGADNVIRWDGTKVYTRGGDDRAFVGSENGGARWVDGGAGNDELTAGHAGGTLIGGTGNDTLRLSGWDGAFKVEMTGGAGVDTFQFGFFEGGQSTKPIINDFAAKGTVQDILDLRSYQLEADSVEDAFADGLISISSSKGYTTMEIEGTGYSSDLTLLFKGTLGSDIYDNIWI